MTDKKKVYVSGPMRGYANNNFDAFHAARDALVVEGYKVLCPALMSMEHAADTGRTMDDITFEEYMRINDIPAILEADMVMVLPGWEKSVGARAEVLIAQIIGVPVVDYLDQWETITVDLTAALDAAVA